MKTITLLLLLLTGTLFAQPNIGQPDNILVCDDNLDGAFAFDLTINESQTLNGLNPTLYSISYFISLVDAESGTNPFSNPSSFTNTSSPQTIYVRVEENADSNNVAITNFDILVNLPPNTVQPSDLIIYEDPYDGFAVFDLTSTHEEILNGLNPGSFSITHYETLSDAQNNVAAISNPFAYNNVVSGSQTLYVAIADNATGCRVVYAYTIIVLDGVDDIVFIPDANFKNDLINDGVDLNNDGEIQFSEANLVTSIIINSQSIMDMTGLEAFVNVTYLSANNNGFASIDVSALSELFFLRVSANNLTTLDVSNNTALEYLDFSSNQVQDINLVNNTAMIELYCNNNVLSELDLSSLINLEWAGLSNNPNLTYINIKNGNNDNYFTGEGPFINLPGLEFVCVDDANSTFSSEIAAQIGFPVVISDYCSFTPGGDYNTITGNITFDSNNDGCDSGDAIPPFIKININDGVTTGSSFTNQAGQYSFFTQDGNFTVSPNIENPNFFNATPSDVVINFPDAINNVFNQDFCITANGVHPDLEVVIAPIMFARPGFDATYLIAYKNKGNQTLSGDVSFTYDDNVIDFISATETPTAQATGLLTWDYTSLMPFEVRSHVVTLNVNGPMETPPINIDDILNFSASITPTVGDELPSDNQFEYDQRVVGSYDPNDITCIEGPIVSPDEIGNYLHYIINFENTGNASAENIVVKAQVDPTMFDVNSLRLLSTSHNAEVKVNNDMVEIIFQTINLESGGHGNILLKMETTSDLTVNSTVTESAEIFFDYNFPIVTNDANTTFATLSVSEFETDTTVSVVPNPTIGMMTIKSKNEVHNLSLYDIQGRLVQSKIAAGIEVSLDVSSQSDGIYFLRVTTEFGVHVEKIIKK